MFIVHIAGHLGKDPETRFTPSGQKVTTFNIATNHRKGKEDVTIWVRVTVWGDRFDKIISYLKKGSAVVVMGKLNPPSSYTDKEGRTQISLEVTAEMIEFSPFGKSDRNGEPAQQGSATHEQGGYEDQFQSTSYHKPQASYGTSSYSHSGQGNSSSHASLDDDALPF
ncbi:single-stranded DNA-binding protein [Candidatus Protochlamydia phocaeensis]|uniref:single-stranded DNA-binding protein n=1 Tax=Candidatus Protochlamydia phocaeensis TaxID=1414722 RepID=UPI00083953B5|nr:single-stranded DNA-binding protein [Candidatus Protochlamydia phocaeensis]